MFEFILIEANRPFTIAIAVMLGIGMLELLLALGGLGLSGLLDNLVPDDWQVDFDAGEGLEIGDGPDIGDGVEAGDGLDGSEVGDAGGSALAMVLSFFGIGRAPLLVVIVAFLTCFGLAGLVIQAVVAKVLGFYLAPALASIPAVIGGALVSRRVAILLGRLIPDVETSAVESGSFIGRTAVLTLGDAKPGRPAQARLRDRNGQRHYVMVEPDQADTTFREGERVLLVGRNGGVFQAISVPSRALTPDAPGGSR